MRPLAQSSTSSRDVIWWVITLGLGLVAGGLVPRLDVSASMLMLLIVALVTIFQFRVLQVATRQRVPLVGVVVLILNTVGVLGTLFFRQVAGDAHVSARLPSDDQVYAASARIFTVASLALTAGGVLVRCPRDQRTLSVGSAFARLPTSALFLASTLPAFLLLSGYGPTGLMRRDTYLEISGPQELVSLGNALLPGALGLLAYLLFDEHRRRARPLVLATLLAYVVLALALGSRVLALVPGLLLLGFVQHAGAQGLRRRLNALTLVATAVASLALLQTALELRTTPGPAGLVPFARHLLDDPMLPLEWNMGGMFGNILFSVPLAGTVYTTNAELPAGSFATSINPLPGTLTNWSSILPFLRINPATPYSGLAELAVHGTGYLAGYCVVSGILLSLIQRLGVRRESSVAVMVRLLGFAVALLFALDLLQYNLRSGTRLLWYLTIIGILAVAIDGSASFRRRADGASTRFGKTLLAARR